MPSVDKRVKVEKLVKFWKNGLNLVQRLRSHQKDCD
jgi:hypothetical protein